MAAWTLVPCLVSLRAEFNAVSPKRDKGADGSIGDSSHTSASDHTPDEDSDALRDHDADSKNEVHALDIDSSGPWPSAGWFDRTIKAIVAREKAEYNSPVMVGRLKYVIWNRQIASRSGGWVWGPYSLADPHTNHAHFSARYESGPESDTRPWGVAKEDDMPLSTDDKDWIARTVEAGSRAAVVDVLADGYTAAMGKATGSTDADRGKRNIRDYLRGIVGGPTGDQVDEAEIVSGVLAGLDPAAIAAAIPQNIAAQVADELRARLQA